MLQRLFDTWESLSVERKLGVVVFSAYIIFYILVLGLYAWVVIRKRNNFYVLARHPHMLLIELLLNGYMSTVIALRQIFADAGSAFPCIAVDLATHIATTNYMSTYYIRALHLCSVYDPSLRKRVFPYVKKNGALKAFVGVSVVTAAVTIGTSQFKLCHSRCHQEGCFLGSIYYYTFVSNQVVLGLLLFVAAEMRRLKIKDQIGIQQELVRAFISSFTLVLFPYYTIIILMDWGVVEGRYWEWAATASILLLLWVLFCWTHLLPSIRFHYTPWEVLVEAMTGSDKDKTKSQVLPTVASDPALKRSPTAKFTARATSGDHNESRERAIYEDPDVQRIFVEACRSYLCEESVLFLLEVKSLQDEEVLEQLKGQALIDRCHEIVAKYVKAGSEYEINVSSGMSGKLIKAVAALGSESAKASLTEDKGPVLLTAIFNPAFREVQKMLFANVLSKLDARQDFQDAYAAFLMKA